MAKAKAPDAFEEAAAAARADREADQLISDMIDGTNNEIAASAWGDDPPVHDESGDQTIEAMGEGLEGQHEPGDEEEAEDEAGEEGTGEEEEGEDEKGEEGDDKAEDKSAKAAEASKAEPEGRVPPGRLREATERARTAEAERDQLKGQMTDLQKSSKDQIDALNARFDRLMAAMQQGNQPKPQETKAETPKRPDVFENPEGFADHLVKSLDDKLAPFQQELRNRDVQWSLKLADIKHGETFRAAVGEIAKLDQSNPNNQRLVSDLYNAPDPGEALVNWHKDNLVRREVGGNPAAYRERIAKETRDALMKDPEFRKQLLDGLRAEATGADGRPSNTTVRLPPSLNGARGGGRETVDTALLSAGDQQSIADSAWDDR